MGQSHPNNDFNQLGSVKKRSAIHIEQENWALLEKPDVDIEEMGNFGIYRNIVTGEVARRYELNLESKKALETFIEEFDYWRSEIRWNVLGSKYIVFEDSHFSLSQLCTSHHPIKFYVENPVVTLAEINDIPVPEGLYILLSSLVGFEYLFNIFGYFSLVESMITINEHGIVKVWLHPNLSSNRPLLIGLNDVSLADIECPDRFIKKLIEIIENNIDYADGDTKFSDYINKKHQNKIILDFIHCRKHLLNFAQELQIDIPDSLSTVLDLLFEKSHQTSISQQGLSQNDGPVLYGKNYENKYMLEDDEQNSRDQRLIIMQNLQSPSENSYFPLRSPSGQFGSFSPQVFPTISMVKKQTQESLGNKNKISSPRNCSYNASSISYALKATSQNDNRSKQFFMHNQYSNNIIEKSCTPQTPQAKNEKQSTIRQEIQQQSFLTSYRTGKLQRDSRKRTSQFEKNMKNIESHKYTFSSKSNSIVKIQNLQNSPLKQDKSKPQSSRNIMSNQSQKSIAKISQKSIQFHTLHEVMELDAQIAQDLENMYKQMGQ